MENKKCPRNNLLKIFLSVVFSLLLIANFADTSQASENHIQYDTSQAQNATPKKGEAHIENNLNQTQSENNALQENQTETDTNQIQQNDVNQTSIGNDIIADNNAESNLINYDPYEKFNRAMFSLNRAIDKAFIRPLALIYDKLLPNFAQKGINNFFNNVGVIPSIANDILQINFIKAISDTWRLIINTTVGVGGLFDVATRLGLDKTNNDLQLTFMKWGAKKTPYLFLPFIGPTSFRDFIGLTLNYEFLSIYPHIHPNEDRYALIALWYIETRDALLSGDKLVDEAFDPYVLVRSAYMQHREYLLSKVTGRADIEEELNGRIVR